MNKEAPLRIGIILMIILFSVMIALQRGSDSDNITYEERVKEDIFGSETKEGFLPALPFDIRAVMSKAGLSNKTFCPFINPYMSQLFAAGSLEVSKNYGNPLYHALLYSMDRAPQFCADDCNRAHPPIVVDCEPDDRACFGIYRAEDEIRQENFQTCVNDCIGTEATCETAILAEYDYENENYVLSCGDYSRTLEIDELADGLNRSIAYLGSIGLSDYGLSVNDKIAGWQCFVFFGIIPFFAMYFFLMDIMGFTMFSRKLKILLTIFGSVLAIMSGTFAKFIWQLSYIAALGVQGTFLLVMVFLSFISLIMSWIGSIGAASGDASRRSAELSLGMAEKYTFQALGRAVQHDNKKN